MNKDREKEVDELQKELDLLRNELPLYPQEETMEELFKYVANGAKRVSITSRILLIMLVDTVEKDESNPDE